MSQVKIIIDSLERNLFSIDFKLNEKQNVTCSFGFAEYKDGDNLDSLLKKADESMYFIKAKYKERKSTFN